MAYSRQDIIHAISQASETSGVDFSYLVNQAAAESNFDADAKASTSSATGLYQFIDSTWLDMVERYGSEYGIETQGLSDDEILEMRNDPETSSFMAAAFASENERSLNNNWGGDVGATELYFAHFMGASGAASFLNARDENPLQNAADLFPRAARANRNVFYDSETGDGRTLEEVYAFFDKKFNDENAVESNTTLLAAADNSVNDNNSSTNSLYSPSRSLSDSVIMQRAQAMRDAASSRSTYARALYYDSDTRSLLDEALSEKVANSTNTLYKASTRNRLDTGPLSGLLAEPLDLMMLTQTSLPGKVIDDSDG